MLLLLSTFATSVASALLPLINIELYLGLVATRVGPGHEVALAVTAGLGQTVGKLIWYEACRRSVDSAWVQKRLEKERWRTSFERWRERVHDRPWYAGAVMFASALVGLPPLLVMAMVAGTLRMPLWMFIPTVFVGRTLRFLLLLWGLDSLLP